MLLYQLTDIISIKFHNEEGTPSFHCIVPTKYFPLQSDATEQKADLDKQRVSQVIVINRLHESSCDILMKKKAKLENNNKKSTIKQ